MTTNNKQLLLISGSSATGKSASLRNIRNQNRWFYFNFEAGKELPFANSFKEIRITDPKKLLEYLDSLMANQDKFDGIIIDTLTFMMDMYESVHVLNAKNTMAAWGDYQQFFKLIMQHYVPQINKPIIFLAHTKDIYDEANLSMKTVVPVKGALSNTGIEAYFSTVLSTKRVGIDELSDQDKSLLPITEEDEAVGFKYVFQTRITKKTTGERIRSPMGMFKLNQTYTDNDAQLILDHLDSYYGKTAA